MEKIKNAYLFWYEYRQIMPKIHRYSLGQKMDNLFVEIIEAVATASFLIREQKLPYVRRAIQKLDTLRILLMVLWETKTLEDEKYIALSAPLDEIGRMLGGWNGQLAKQNSPGQAGEK